MHCIWLNSNCVSNKQKKINLLYYLLSWSNIYSCFRDSLITFLFLVHVTKSFVLLRYNEYEMSFIKNVINNIFCLLNCGKFKSIHLLELIFLKIVKFQFSGFVYFIYVIVLKNI